MSKIVVEIEEAFGLYCPQAHVGSLRYSIGWSYTTRWSAKRGARRFLNALGATNWRFADEPEAVAEPAVKGVHPWARWEATDQSGYVFEYEREPKESDKLFPWWCDRSGGRVDVVRAVSNPVENWRETKRKVNV